LYTNLDLFVKQKELKTNLLDPNYVDIPEKIMKVNDKFQLIENKFSSVQVKSLMDMIKNVKYDIKKKSL